MACVLAKERGDVLVAGFFVVARAGGVELAELVEDHGGAFGGLFCFGLGRIEENGASKFAHIVAAEGHVLEDIEPVGVG